MENSGQTLYVDLLSYEHGKAYGFNEYVNNLLCYLHENRDSLRFNEIVLVIQQKEQARFEHLTDKFRLRTFVIDSFLKRVWFQTFWPLRVPIRKHDVLLCLANYTPVVTKGRVVLVIHDLLFKHRELIRLNLMRLQREIYMPLSIRRARKIICISKFTESEVHEYYPAGRTKTEVIYNCFDFNKFKDADSSGGQRQGILSVCSAAPHKNTVLVLRAFEKYCDNGGCHDLFLVGSLKKNTAPYAEYDRLPANVKERIHVRTNISNAELGRLYKSSKIYVSASKFEGLGMPLVEAMYFGMHLVVPKHPEIFREITSDKALFFDSDNADELSAALSAAQDAAETPAYDLDSFSTDNTVKRYIRALNDERSEK